MLQWGDLFTARQKVALVTLARLVRGLIIQVVVFALRTLRLCADPPYYDQVPYADLADFFFVWLKRTLPGHTLLRHPYDPVNPLSPKTRECVWNVGHPYEGRPKDQAFFEKTMAKAFAEGRRVLKEDGVGAVVFAHKTTEGWEALLSGMIRGGWTITGSWPIVTEMGSRLRARDSAALATSVHLICRPRPDDAPVGDWADVLRELPKRVGDWMERLQGEGIRGADLVFACIGPALEIFSREATMLDRAHMAMLLQAGGRVNALRAMLKAEQERGPDFLRLANALSALYPKGSEEKRLLDAMLLAVPR